MNYYPHHIGDFDRTTRHLTRIERSVYRDLMDLYYDTEARLTLDMARLYRRIVAKSKVEQAAVVQVLVEFFEKTETGWYHSRCEYEISTYQANGSQKSMAGKASAEARRLKKEQELSSGNSTGEETSTNPARTGVEQSLNSVETGVEREVNGESTNQNQNQNQNQNTHSTAGEQPPGEPDGSVCVSICQKMQEVGVKDANASDKVLGVLIEKGADVGMFVDAAVVALGKGKDFAYALGIVKNKMTAAAALEAAPLAAPVAAAPSVGKPDVSRITVPMSPNAQAALRQLDVDAAIPRSGPSAEVRQKMAMLKGTPVARQAGVAV
jgi:uncharacterized protein YdaU (DUF1376 family)